MISVLLPSRKRSTALFESCQSLVTKAAHRDDIEILVAIDPDDDETRTAELPSQVQVWEAPERFGYDGLHHYVNFLARQAMGTRLMIWNDDAIMQTQGWDEIVRRAPADSALWMEANHSEGGNLFPLWPLAWTEAIGYVSLSPNIDVWISEVARRLGLEERIPVKVLHDRADITGSNNDETFAEGRAKMGTGNHVAYDSYRNRAARTHDVAVIRALLEGSTVDQPAVPDA